MRAIKFLVILAGFVLTSCGGGDFFESDKTPKLPGERINPLAKISDLQPDKNLGDIKPGFSVTVAESDWQQPFGGAKHVPGHRELSSQPTLKWAVDIGEGTNNEERRIIYPPVSDGKFIFALDAGNQIVALEVESGKEIWRRNPVPDDEEGGYGGGLSLSNGKLYLAAGFGSVVAFNSENGDELWRTKIPTPSRAAPSIDRGRVFVLTIDNRLIALDGDSGRILWSFEAPAASATFIGGASPAAAAGAVVAAMSTGEIFALSAVSGRIVWQDTLNVIRGIGLSQAIPAGRALPVIDDGQVIAVGAGGFTTSINFVTGQRIWDAELGSSETPAVVGDFVFMISDPDRLVALRRTDGAIVWVTNLRQIAGDIKPDDKRPDRKIYAGPIAAGGNLIIIRGDGVLFFVQPGDGTIAHRIKLSGSTVLAPIVVNKTLVVLTEDGVLAAYR
jgi:outer membrane protein assembly factor BamB